MPLVDKCKGKGTLVRKLASDVSFRHSPKQRHVTINHLVVSHERCNIQTSRIEPFGESCKGNLDIDLYMLSHVYATTMPKYRSTIAHPLPAVPHAMLRFNSRNTSLSCTLVSFSDIFRMHSSSAQRLTPQTPRPPLIPSQSLPWPVRPLWGAQLTLLTS